ncbi:MAG: serine/threonine-protein kinase [Myxococcota bacterium]
MKLDMGQVVDRYTVERILGAGGTAMVYLVKHNRLGTRHALKVLTLTGQSIRDRMEREGQVQAKLNHLNVVAVTDQIDIDGALGLLMEFIDGPSLETALGRYRLTMGDAETLFAGILAGVKAAHREGLVHRDLKPANVLLDRTPDGFVPKVTDFGLAKVLEQDVSIANTRSGIAMGTPSYMAPEQIRDARSVDQRADLWSLGCILYELTCRLRAFPGDEALAIYNNVVDGEFVPPRTLVPDIPDRIEQAILGCLQIDPDARIPSCEMLKAVIEGEMVWSQGRDDGQTTDFVLPRRLGAADPQADVPTLSVARRGPGGATPPPAPPRGGFGGELAPVGLEPAVIPASLGFDAGEESETVLTHNRTGYGPATGVPLAPGDGTLSPLDSFDRPVRAGVLGFLGGGLLAVAFLAVIVLVVSGASLGLVGSMLLSKEPAPIGAVAGPDPSIGTVAPSPSPGSPVPVSAAPAAHPEPFRDPLHDHPDLTPDPAPSPSPAPSVVSPAPHAAPAPGPAPEPVAVAAPVPTVEPTSAVADGLREVTIQTLPRGAMVTIRGHKYGRAPQKVGLAPGQEYVVELLNGTQSGEFVIDLDADSPTMWCYRFEVGTAVIGTCPQATVRPQ